MKNDLPYYENISSRRTELLFLLLTIFFLLPFLWRVTAGVFDFPAGLFLLLSGVFLFYTLNFRILSIQLTTGNLKLTFGIFRWTIPLNNIAGCRLDELPPIMKYGGAGIHFMFIGGRYRASFNFLEYPRVVIAFKRKGGLVQVVSFSTRRPEELIRLVQGLIPPGNAPQAEQLPHVQ